jgi:hypothetical protein
MSAAHRAPSHPRPLRGLRDWLGLQDLILRCADCRKLILGRGIHLDAGPVHRRCWQARAARSQAAARDRQPSNVRVLAPADEPPAECEYCGVSQDGPCTCETDCGVFLCEAREDDEEDPEW